MGCFGASNEDGLDVFGLNLKNFKGMTPCQVTVSLS